MVIMSFASKKLSYGKGPSASKKIPENPRYKHVKSCIDTGASVSKYLERLEEIKTNYRYRKDEIFKRLKVTTFAQLVLQVAEVDATDDMSTPLPSESITGTVASVASPVHVDDYPESPPGTARSTLSSVISGLGELDISQNSSLASPRSPYEESPQPPCPYLLLDVRYKEDYDQCHIITAKSYPASMLSRSCNYFTEDILNYQNKPGKIIILYDEDERIAPNAATTFVQRGVDNVFMLSGGMKVLYKTFPEGILSGEVPASCQTTPLRSSRTRNATEFPVGSGYRPDTKGHKKYFTVEDLETVQHKLDDALLSSSRASSRAYVNSSAGHRSSASSRQDSFKPWK